MTLIIKESNWRKPIDYMHLSLSDCCSFIGSTLVEAVFCVIYTVY